MMLFAGRAFAAVVLLLGIQISQPVTAIDGDISAIEYRASGDRVLQVGFRNPGGQLVYRPITIKANGSVVDWRGVEAYAAGQANARLTSINNLRNALDTDLTNAIAAGKIVSPFQ